MALSFSPSGVAATLDPIREAPPIRSNLLVWHRLGSNLARSRRNLAAAGLPAAVAVGTPDVQPTYANLLGSANYLTDAIAETGDCSMLFVARSDDTQAAGASRIAPGGYGNDGLSIYGGGATVLRASAYWTVGGVKTVRTATLAIAAGFAAWRLYAAVAQAGVGVTLYNLTDGTSAATADATNARALAAPGFRTGSVLGGTAGGMSQIALCALYGQALTLTQLQTLRTYIAARMAERGITV